ncbi:MAG: restriction endonuclease subunit S [Truepera sp.]|nr:restriction endonuclease subunit S [Truepera sp.]
MIDLNPNHLGTVKAILAEHVPECEVRAFGSRATWTAKDYSDLDLAILGKGPLDWATVGRLEEAFEESDLPMRVDVLDWHTISGGFREVIEREHVVLVDTPTRDSTTKDWLYHPRLPNYWKRKPLYAMAQWVNGLAFRKIQFSSTGKPIIKIAELKGGISGQTKFTDQTFDDSVRVRPGDLLFSWSGQPETSIDAFWWRGPEGWLNQHIFRVTPNNGVDTTFFYYLLRYLRPNFVNIARNKQTTGLGHVTKRDLENIEAATPNLPEQRTIAQILGSFDDKIELNRQLNETLEELARAIFKDWFVDFGPVRAKLEGRDTGLPEQLAELFPDRLVESELGGIPEGWEVGAVGEIADQRRHGARPEQIAPDTPYIALEHMPKRCIALYDWDMATGLASSKFRFERGDILFGKLRPYFHKVGVAPLDGVCSTDIVVVSPKSHDWFGLVLGHTSSAKFVDYTDARATGTRMPRTKWTDMADYKIALPDRELARAFTRQIQPWVDRIVSAIHESYSLAALQNALLPKLVSGEVRVEELARDTRGMV